MNFYSVYLSRANCFIREEEFQQGAASQRNIISFFEVDFVVKIDAVSEGRHF